MGPALASLEKMQEAILAGVDIFRINYSHGTREDHAESIKRLREAASKLEREITIIADLQGPKIRIACFRDKKVILEKGQVFVIDMSLDKHSGDHTQVGCDYKALIDDVHPKDTLLLDDGRLVFHVETIGGSQIRCRVAVGGELSNHKGINRQGGGLSARALTEKDKLDLKEAVAANVDYLAISFPRNAEDMLEAKSLIKEAKGKAGVIAKIERTEALTYLDEIIKASDGVMVARGDLAVEIGDAEVPAAQKIIIQRARALNRVVITATQMMESMIHSSVPTRAEVSDVANAVLDGTDCVMLSAETAVGDYPIETICAMARVCLSAEKNPASQRSGHRMECHFERPDEAIAMAAMYTANHIDIDAIISLTESGTTPLWMSRIRSGIPIFALTRHESTARKMMLFRGVYPVLCNFTLFNQDKFDHEVMTFLKEKHILEKGSLIILTKGDLMGVHGYTNCMKIERIE